MKQDIDINVSFEELLATCSAERQWLLDLIEEEVIIVEGSPEQAQFSGLQMARVRKAYRIGHDFEASVPALGLIMRLLDEVEELRKLQYPPSFLEESERS